MAEKDEQVGTYKLQNKLDVLRAKDIIPGSGRTPGKDVSDSRSGVPRFDLAQDIMAEQRRLSAIRRKGPSSILNTHPSRHKRTISTERQWDPIIAEIVARDIKRLCEYRQQ